MCLQSIAANLLAVYWRFCCCWDCVFFSSDLFYTIQIDCITNIKFDVIALQAGFFMYSHHRFRSYFEYFVLSHVILRRDVIITELFRANTADVIKSNAIDVELYSHLYPILICTNMSHVFKLCWSSLLWCCPKMRSHLCAQIERLWILFVA